MLNNFTFLNSVNKTHIKTLICYTVKKVGRTYIVKSLYKATSQ